MGVNTPSGEQQAASGKRQSGTKLSDLIELGSGRKTIFMTSTEGLIVCLYCYAALQ